MKRATHLGSPCIYCDQTFETIEVGECPGRTRLEWDADLQLTVDRLLEREANWRDRIGQAERIRLRLIDICANITPSIIYRLLGDDAAVAAGLPLWPAKARSDVDLSAPIDLDWAKL